MAVCTAEALDHFVLTVTDIEKTCSFYETVLGMRREEFAPGRWSLRYGTSKINLHLTGHEFRPHAAEPVCGSADLCFLTAAPIAEAAAALMAAEILVEEGPVS